jgi:hypothetical protein
MRYFLAVLLLIGAAFGQTSLRMGSVPFEGPIRGGIAFTLTDGGPFGACYVGNGFCWDAGGSLLLHKTGGFCAETCDVTGSVGTISAMALPNGCSQVSFRVSNVTLKVGTIVRTGRNGWYSQTSCTYPSGFMGGGTLFVYQ